MHLSINLGVDTLKKSDLDVNELLILAIIYSYERNAKPCNLKRETLAKYLNVSEWAIQRLYTSLKAKNYIFITRQTKKLTQKAITFCQSYFAYKLTKRQKKEQREPSWYARYQEQIQAQREQEKAISEQSKTSLSDMQEIARDLFGD